MAPENLPDPTEAYYLHLCGYPAGKRAMIQWGVDVLCAGGEGRYTTWLAGADDLPPGEVAELFLKALAAQQVSVSNDPQARLVWHEKYICQQIVDGSLPPNRGLQWLRIIWIESRYSPIFSRWEELDDSIDLIGTYAHPGFECLTLDDVDETIINEARKVLDGHRYGS